MTFDQVQAYFSGLITSDALLGPSGANVQPIVVDPFVDPETAKSAIAEQIRAVGICVEVGFPWIAAPETLLDGTTKIEAQLEMFVAEGTQETHTPNRATLLMRVITACTIRPGGILKPARLYAAESVKTEQGYVLHMLTFGLPMNIKQP